METISIADPPEELRERVEYAVATSRIYIGACALPEQRIALGADLKVAMALKKEIEERRVEISGPINKGLRALNRLFALMSDPIDKAISDLKREALRYDLEEDRKKAAAVREAARIADQARKDMNVAADQAVIAGNIELGAALAATAQMIAPVPVAVDTVKVEGESHQEIWRAECYAPLLTCLAISDGTLPLSDDDEAALAEFFAKLFGPRARSLKNALNIPGVRAVPERILKSRAA